jgi:heme ABC exporter ATP-binding subunit CcmA
MHAAGGEILAIVGPNGAGKTTLLKVLSGERTPDSGEVSANGSAVSGRDPAWRARVGLVSHRTGLYEKLTVMENLRFFGALRGVGGNGRGRLDAALEAVGAEGLAGWRVEALSRGQRQRVALARSLLHEPEVLFLDEPFAGLDPAASAGLEHVLLARRATGAVVVLVTHDLRRGLRLADRVVVLRRGRVAFEGAAVGDGAAELLEHFTAAAPVPS